ncbi:DNA (cytosine-5-)-methyltransferase [Methanomassiliicoccales archaeon LGM-RCC1]|nr:DNA (cytosine-5-)-methyltransferase [Methanomassiliicoccales archaeon LGM-RCC1]
MESCIRVVELFAGVGGFRVGLERASSERFKTIWANQWEPKSKMQAAFTCYEYHYGNSGSKNVNEDISKVRDDVPKDFELLVGGFPCQDYSVASTHAKGIQGKKGVLWWDLYHIVQKHHPRYILLENVDRLLKSPVDKRGRDFGVILRCLSDEGYYVEWRVINANDYGMVQRRRRTFIFACRENHPFIKTVRDIDLKDLVLSKGYFQSVFPVKGLKDLEKIGSYEIKKSYKGLVDVSDRFEGRFYNSGVMSKGNIYTCETVPKYRKKKGEGLLSTVVDSCDDPAYLQEDYIDKWIEMKGSKRLLRTNKKTGIQYYYSEGSIPFPDPLDKPGRTMLTSEGTRNRSSHVIRDPGNGMLRVLTPEECEKLNGFEPGWTFMLSKRQRYFTMGNALVVDLIERMGKGILSLEDM